MRGVRAVLELLKVSVRKKGNKVVIEQTLDNDTLRRQKEKHILFWSFSDDRHM